MSRFTQNTFGRVAAAAVVIGLVACQSEGLTSQDTARTPIAFAVGDNVGDATNSTPEFGKIKVCKSASSNVSGVFAFTRTTVNTSTGSSLTDATIAPANCVVVAVDMGEGQNGSNVTITETSDGLVSITGQRIDGGGGGIVTAEPFSNGDSRFVNLFHGYTFTFTNTVSAGNNGCSPGYYKNHAFPDPFTSSTTFLEVFGNDVYGDATLLTVLKTGGGGLAALGRQTVAAYFNATIYSDFGYSPQEVIDAFNAAVAGTSADQKSLQGTFEALTDVDGRICTNPTGK